MINFEPEQIAILILFLLISIYEIYALVWLSIARKRLRKSMAELQENARRLIKMRGDLDLIGAAIQKNEKEIVENQIKLDRSLNELERMKSNAIRL